MKINHEADTGECDIHCGESLTIYHVREMYETFTTLLKEANHWRFDFSATRELDTAGVQLLLAAKREILCSGGSWQVRQCSDEVRQALQLLNLAADFACDEEAAPNAH